MGDNYPGWQLDGWEFFLGGNSSGGSYPECKFSMVGVSLVPLI